MSGRFKLGVFMGNDTIELLQDGIHYRSSKPFAGETNISVPYDKIIDTEVRTFLWPNGKVLRIETRDAAYEWKFNAFRHGAFVRELWRRIDNALLDKAKVQNMLQRFE
jgi:hypothetical protein